MLLMLEAKTALHCIEILGIMIHASDEICTKLVNDPELRFLDAMQQVLIEGDSNLKMKVLWTFNNIICNSQDDLMKLIEKNILSNVSNACRCQNNEVKEEATWMMASVIKILEDEPSVLKPIVQQHELIEIFLENLTDGNSSMQKKCVSIEVFNILFNQN